MVEDVGKLRMTLLDSDGAVIDYYEIPQDDLFEETINAFAEEVYDASASKVMMVRLDYEGKNRGFETIEVDEYFPRFIDRLIEEYEEDSDEEGLMRELHEHVS